MVHAPSRRLEKEEMLHVARGVAAGINFIHSRGICHRDLKPENVLLSSSGYAKLVDMGLAKMLSQDGLTHTTCGSPDYFAPEVIAKRGVSA